MRHTVESSLIHRIHQSAVIDLLRESGPLARTEIARRLQLPASVVVRIVNALIQSGHVLECAEPRLAVAEAGSSPQTRSRPHAAVTGAGGRRPALVEYNARSSLIIGVALESATFVGALTDLNGNILRRNSLPALPGESGVEQVIKLIDLLHQEANRLGLSIRQVCVGVQSVIQQPEGIVLLAPMLNWRNLALKQQLEAALGLPVYLENNENLRVLGEAWRGAGRGIDTFVCLAFGSGIGAGLVINGRLHRGAHQAAGEVGHMLPNERMARKQPMRYGAVEGLAGHEGILARARKRLAHGEPSDLQGKPLTIEAVLRAARKGDPLAVAVMEETLTWLTIVVVGIIGVIDPERIIFCPELPEFGALFLEPLRMRIRGLVPASPSIVLGELAHDATIYGAISAVLHESGSILVNQPSRA